MILLQNKKIFIYFYLNQFEDEIYNGILDHIDLESYSKIFLIKEFTGDPDHLFSSFYFYKERNDDKFYFGPPWDFDLAFANNRETYNNIDFYFRFTHSAGTAKEFVNTLIGNKNVIEYIQKTWEKLCKTSLNEKILIDFLEEEKVKIKESAELNFLKWDNFVGEPVQEPIIRMEKKGENFEVSFDVVKDYVIKRFNVLTNLINNAILSSK